MASKGCLLALLGAFSEFLIQAGFTYYGVGLGQEIPELIQPVIINLLYVPGVKSVSRDYTGVCFADLLYLGPVFWGATAADERFDPNGPGPLKE